MASLKPVFGNIVRLIRVPRSIAIIALLIIVQLLSLSNYQLVAALSQDQINALSSGIYYFNTESTTCSGSTTESVPVGTLPTFIPEPYNGAFTEGADNHNVAPALIAALFSEEHNLGNNGTDPDLSAVPASWAAFPQQQPDPNSGWASSSAGAEGPFQFEPSTFTGLGYNIADINNLVISADAAGKYAQTDGATKNTPVSSWSNFIFSYNHADWYVQAVLDYYNYYNSAGSPAPGGGSTVITSPVSDSGDCVSNGTTVNCNNPSTTSGLSQVRQNVVCLAEQQLQAWTPLPPIPRLGYTKYSQGALEEWCADFASWIYDQAGYPLQPDPNWRLPGVDEIQAVGEQEQNFHWHPVGSGYAPRPGDLVIHGGSHVNIVISVSGGTMTLIGGDGGDDPGQPVPQDDYGGPNSESYVEQNTNVPIPTTPGDITGYVSPD